MPDAGNRFAALRDRREWTQAEAAAYFGFGVRTWQGWEAGRRTPSGLVELLARVLDQEDELERLRAPKRK